MSQQNTLEVLRDVAIVIFISVVIPIMLIYGTQIFLPHPSAQIDSILGVLLIIIGIFTPIQSIGSGLILSGIFYTLSRSYYGHSSSITNFFTMTIESIIITIIGYKFFVQQRKDSIQDHTFTLALTILIPATLWFGAKTFLPNIYTNANLLILVLISAIFLGLGLVFPAPKIGSGLLMGGVIGIITRFFTINAHNPVQVMVLLLLLISIICLVVFDYFFKPQDLTKKIFMGISLILLIPLTIFYGIDKFLPTPEYMITEEKTSSDKEKAAITEDNINKQICYAEEQINKKIDNLRNQLRSEYKMDELEKKRNEYYATAHSVNLSYSSERIYHETLVFIIAMILGLLLILFGLIFPSNISGIAFMFSGTFSSLLGISGYWHNFDEKIRFIILLLAAIIIIAIGYFRFIRKNKNDTFTN